VLSRIEVPRAAIDAFELLRAAIEESLPSTQKRAKGLALDIRKLWRSLTSERDSRMAGYLSSDASLHAYARYFLPWNVLRVSSIFASRDFEGLAPSSILDLGSGPLTVPIALWLARPELRAAPIEVVCVDLSRKAMEAGARILEALAAKVDGKALAWKISLRRESAFDSSGRDHDFVCAANVFNEHFWASKETLQEKSERLAIKLSSLAAPYGRIFVMEPGDPRSGTLIVALRDALLSLGRKLLAPCPHSGPCPMPGFRMLASERAGEADAKARKGGKRPWCHTTLAIEHAPEWLSRLSRDASLEKEKLVASWLYAGPVAAQVVKPKDTIQREEGVPLRVISAPFKVRGGYGCYSCTYKGFSIFEFKEENGFRSGDRVLATELEGERDEVSGARIFE
jgi:ribosomal protein RSM22 (predicted rRNA methylase)